MYKRNSIRVAQVVPFGVHPFSGVLTAVVNLSIALTHRGNRVELWQLNPWPEAARDYAEALDAAGVERIRLQTTMGPWMLGADAARQIAERTVPLVHLHGVFSPLNNFITRRLEAPYVLSPHGGYAPAVLKRHGLRKAVFKQVFELRMLAAASLVCALNEAERDEVRGFGFRGPIEVIPNAVEVGHEKVDGRVFRRELGLDVGARLAVFVGRLDLYYKRLDHLVEAMEAVPDWHLVLVGPDWRGSAQHLAQLIRDLNVEERVRLVGPRSGNALQEVLAAANVFILISRSEGFPIALLEALAHGTPALVSPEVDRATGVSAAAAGWSVTPNELASRLNTLAGLDAEVWERMSQSARKYAARYCWDGVAQLYEERVAHAIPHLRAE